MRYPCSQWMSVVAAPRALAPLTTALDVTEEAVAHSTFSPPPFGHAPRYYALHWPLLHHRCPLPMNHPELSDRAKRITSSPCPSCTKSMPAVPASEAGPRDLPAVIFLHEQLTGGGGCHNRRQGAPPRPPLRPLRPLSRPFTGVSSPSACAPL
jgi:hypothetical protein